MKVNKEASAMDILLGIFAFVIIGIATAFFWCLGHLKEVLMVLLILFLLKLLFSY